MCGIAGVLDPGAAAESLAANAAAMTASLRHRGPDGDGLWTDYAAGIALGHRRLSILDLSPLGAQPMHSQSGRFVVTFNGEIYNFGDMRWELEQRGLRFRGGSDTEVLLAACETWGIEAAVAKFVGMFAFALWDREARELILVRDRIGVKPLYWAAFGTRFLFGSEMKALLAHAGWQPEIDRDAVAAYVRWNYVPSPWSIFRCVAKLAPGCLLKVRPGCQPEIHRYWDLRAIAAHAARHPSDLSDAEAEQQLEALLRDSVRRRMIADVPLGAFLSGGIDSSLVVALMQAQSQRRVRTYSIGFHDPEYNEATHAANVARHLGTEHTELYIGPEEALAAIPRLPDYYDEPFADSSQVNMLLVSQMTRQHVTVALSGDGGDELFAGYTRYHWAEMTLRRFHGMPPVVRGLLATAIETPTGPGWEIVARVVPAKHRPQRVGERAMKLAGFLRESDADGIYRRQHTQWLDPERIVRGGREPKGVPFDATLASEVPDFLARMQLVDALTYLPDDIMTKVDRASMAVGLEAREPLLDHRLVEFAWRLPRHMKVRDGVDKWLLRRILHRYMPRAILERPKMGFGVPIGRWLRGPLRAWAESLLEADCLRDYFDPAPIQETWRGFLVGRNAQQEPLWGILMFEAWRMRYAQDLGRAAPPANFRRASG